MNIINKIIVKLIKLYKNLISPYLGNNCRFYPTCSSYSITAFQRYNLFKAAYLSLTRILRCNQFFPGGIDHVPKKEDKNL